jgi:ribosomal protein S25
MLKIFSLIEFGERAGSGLSGICKVWGKVYHTPAILEETHNDGVDRTTLTLSTGGNEQDVKAMLELYSNLLDQEKDQTDQETGQTDQEKAKADQEKAKTDQENAKTDQETISDQVADEKHKIYQLIKSNPQITRIEIARGTGLHDSSVKRRLESLIADGLIRRVGSTKGGHWEIL